MSSGMEEALKRIAECKKAKSKTLNLRQLELKQFPVEICDLKWLQILRLGGNLIETIPLNIGSLSELRQLDLSANLINNLPSTIGNLSLLQSLNLNYNEISDIPESIKYMSRLEVLWLNDNKINILPQWIGQLTKVEKLYLSNNYLTKLREEIEGMTQLRELHLSNNNIFPFPKFLLKMKNLELLNLQGNNLLHSALINNYDFSVVRDYFASMDREVALTEVKVLILGEANVGKTALVKQLMSHGFSQLREPTTGIAIQDWSIPVNGRPITLHLWDFGGQEIMHNTHQFFLTTHSLYLLVLDATQNEESNGVVKWLKTIHLHAPDAPVIIVLNKSDQLRLRLNQKELQAIHPVTVFIETSCATGEGILTLRNAIETTLQKMPHFNETIPFRWMEVRRSVVEAKRDYLIYQEFKAVCDEQEMGKKSENIAQFLHSLGVLLTYSNDRTLKHTHILNPNWVTEGIYPILTDKELTQRGGFVTDRDVERILPLDRYPPDKHSFILGMMFNFELAFEIERGRYLVPDLLPKESVTYLWNHEKSLQFVYRYDFLPLAIFTRFVVQMQSEVYPDLVWRTGVILHQRGKPYARVVVHRQANSIEISVLLPEGERRDPRTLLDVLRDKFDTLHSTFKGLKVEEFVPIPNTEGLIAYANLVKLEKRGLTTYYYAEIDAEIDVQQLLDGIEDPHSRHPRHSRHQHEGENHGSRFQKVELSTETGQERRKKLVKIVTIVLGTNPNMRSTLLEAADLLDYEEYQGKFNFGLNGEDFASDLIRKLKDAGFHPETGQPAIVSLLRELQERRSGHTDEVAFLEREIQLYLQK